jgi:hypothetical protein
MGIYFSTNVPYKRQNLTVIFRIVIEIRNKKSMKLILNKKHSCFFNFLINIQVLYTLPMCNNIYFTNFSNGFFCALSTFGAIRMLQSSYLLVVSDRKSDFVVRT